MKKAYILAALMLILSSALVAASDNINIVEDSVQLNGNHDATTDSTFVLQNTGDSFLNITFSDYTLTKGSETLNITPINSINNMENNTNMTVSFSITIPASQEPGNYTGTLNVEGGSASDTVDITLTVNEDISMELTPSILDFGTVLRGISYTETFKIKNEGNTALDNIAISTNADSKYSVSFDTTSAAQLLPGDEIEVEATVSIPDNETEGDKTLGTIFVVSDQKNASIAMNSNVGIKLKITDVDVKVDDDWDNSVDNGDSVYYEAKLESHVTVDVRVENKFNDDIDIENIEVTLMAMYLDGGSDYEDLSAEFDLSEGQEEKISFEFDIPLEFEEEKLEILLTAEGTDDNDTRHEVEFSFYIPIDRSRELMIRSVELLNNPVKCGEAQSISIELVNIGGRDEDYGVLTLKNSDLNLNIKDDFSLSGDISESDSRLNVEYPINIPKTLKAGIYSLDLRVYYDFDELTNYGVKKMTVTCEEKEVEPETPEEEPEEPEEEKEETETEETEPSIPTTEDGEPVLSFPEKNDSTITLEKARMNPGFVIALVILNLIVLSTIIYLIYALRAKNK